MVIAIPSGITAVEKRAVLDSAERAGARRVYLVEEPMAAAIGAGLPVAEPTASHDRRHRRRHDRSRHHVAGRHRRRASRVRVAGDDMDEAIINHMKRTYNLMIGEQTAERIKIEIGSASPLDKEMTMEVRGRDMISGLPRKTVITSEEIREALQEPVGDHRGGDAHAGAGRAGTGGRPGRERHHAGRRRVPAPRADQRHRQRHGPGGQLADDPLTCVARGTAIYLENLEEWKATLENDLSV